MEAALGATTPEVPVVSPDVGQPAQAGGMPEGQQLAPEGLNPEVPQEPQWFLEADTGTKYRTPEAAAAGIAEKDRFIQQLLSERGQFQQPQAPQATPQDATNQAIAQLQAEWEQELRSDPKFQGASPEAIAEQAYLNAKAEYRVQQRTEKLYHQQQQQAQWNHFVESNPDLKTPLAEQVYNNALAAGYRFPNPQAHLDAVHAEMFRQSRGQSQGYGSVNGALQNAQNRQRIFSGVQGTAGPAPQVLSDTVRKQIEFAQQRGFKPDELERIKQRAIENEARMAKR